MKTIRECVSEFHRAAGVPVLDHPTVPGRDRVQLRLRLIAEEFCELFEAAGMMPSAVSHLHSELEDSIDLDLTRPPDLVALADACCDLDYVVEGTRLEFGIDGGPVLEEVQRSNMQKVGGPKREDGKILKPPGWTPPDIARVIEQQKARSAT